MSDEHNNYANELRCNPVLFSLCYKMLMVLFSNPVLLDSIAPNADILRNQDFLEWKPPVPLTWDWFAAIGAAN